MTYRKKLIEVALPLEAINKEAVREKSIRHEYPSTPIIAENDCIEVISHRTP